MSKHFSPPMSAPKPASVTTKPSGPTNLRAALSATTELLPCAMFAKGPACTSTGVPSTVCMSVGIKASRMSTVTAPPTPRSSTETNAPAWGPSALERPTTMRPRRFRRSSMSAASARTAMISEATAMSKPVSRVRPFSVGARPTSTPRRKRSHVSRTRFQVMVPGSTSSRAKRTRSASERSSASSSAGPVTPRRSSRARCEGASGRFTGDALSLLGGTSRSKRAASFCVDSWKTRASSAAATRLFAATIAWMSPVMCRLNSSMGTTWL
mmetsp:Transcript_14050/g.41869  ORF Transcript_14050/g.41869 Transcript_14050/m.41869 type:complete len:268 (-) Transcript_14050:1060-1863(-)